MKSIKAGLIVSIPYQESYAIAKILYLSKYFKNIALFKIYNFRITSKDKYKEVLKSDSFQLIYTGIASIKKKHWEELGNEELSVLEEKASKRIVGGDTWFGDDCLGRASDNDLKTLPKMKVWNVNRIEEKIGDYPLIT